MRTLILQILHTPQWRIPAAVLLLALPGVSLGQTPDLIPEAPPARIEVVAGEIENTVSIHVDGGSMQQVLKAFAIQSGRNVVIGPDVVSEDVHLHLNNVQWEEALEVILKPHGFGYRKVGETIVISKLENLAALAAVEPLETRVFTLQFLDAGDVQELLKEQLSPRGRMSVMTNRGQKGWEFAAEGRAASRSAASLAKLARQEDKTPGQQAKSKTIVVTDIPRVLEQIADVLAEVDHKPQQVLVETRFMEVNENFLRDIGLEFSKIKIGVDDGTFTLSDAFYLVRPSAFTPASTAISGGPLNTFGQVAFSSYSVEALLNVLQEDDNSKVLSAPRILTLNNQEATIIIGEKFPIIESNVSGASGDSITSTTLDYYENIGIQLNVVPQISGDNYINMIVHPAVSSIADFETGVVTAGSMTTPLTRYPRIKIREAETQILLRSGETIIIGGLLEEREQQTLFKIPLLGDIPLIKYFFRRSTVDKATVDLLIFLSATIVDIDALPPEIRVPAEEPPTAELEAVGQRQGETSTEKIFAALQTP